MQVHAGRCVDVQQQHGEQESGINNWILTNRCKDPLELTVRNSKQKVCARMQMEPNTPRIFKQLKACHSTNDLFAGCICERSLRTHENMITEAER